MSSNGIRGVLEDSRGRLWINTISGGLNLLDRSRWRFRNWRHERNEADSLSHDGVFALAEAEDGKLWVGTQAGLDLFDPDSGRFEHQIVATGGEFIIDLHRDARGQLWVATLGQGLFREREDGRGFIAVLGARDAAPLDVFALEDDAEGTLWVGTRHGLFHVAAGGSTIEPSGLHVSDGVTSPGNVTALRATPEGGLWVGSFGEGLFWRAPKSSRLEPVDLGVEGPSGQHIDGGNLALDRDGNLIVRTFGAGLLRATSQIVGLETWRAERENHAGLAYEDVYALLPDESGATPRLQVGSFGGGLDEIDLASGHVAQQALPLSVEEQTHLGGITDVLRTPDGTLWASTNEGVWRWHPARGEFHYYDPLSTSESLPGYAFSMTQDHQGRIWVGGAGDGLYLSVSARARQLPELPAAGQQTTVLVG
ncbi:MAG TPA: two-component regulator propeller domain-containing protein [Chiayiivirga sp.]|nr:two-component regulator propeller domain-containing protein [Chiayiivirga sp.]